MEAICKYCGGVIPAKRVSHRGVFCSEECKREWYKIHPASGTAGAISKQLSLRVAVCEGCGGEIPEERQRRGALYCSDNCRRELFKKLYKTGNPRPQNTSTGTTGVVSELRVAIDLLYRGYNVFRALSPNGPCDLAILKEDKLLKVEVKTAYYSPHGGSIHMPKPRTKDYDVLASVLHDKIIYEPSLDGL